MAIFGDFFGSCICNEPRAAPFRPADAGLLVLSLTVEALQGKMCQNSLPSGGGRSLAAKISGGRGRPWGIFFGLYKNRRILLSDSANCKLTQYRHVTDGQMDGIAVHS